MVGHGSVVGDGELMRPDCPNAVSARCRVTHRCRGPAVWGDGGEPSRGVHATRPTGTDLRVQGWATMEDAVPSSGSPPMPRQAGPDRPSDARRGRGRLAASTAVTGTMAVAVLCPFTGLIPGPVWRR